MSFRYAVLLCAAALIPQFALAGAPSTAYGAPLKSRPTTEQIPTPVVQEVGLVEAVVDGIVRNVQASAPTLGLPVAILRAGSEADIDTAFAELSRSPGAALLVSVDPFFFTRRAQVTGLAARHAIPTIYSTYPNLYLIGFCLMSRIKRYYCVVRGFLPFFQLQRTRALLVLYFRGGNGNHTGFSKGDHEFEPRGLGQHRH